MYQIQRISVHKLCTQAPLEQTPPPPPSPPKIAANFHLFTLKTLLISSASNVDPDDQEVIVFIRMPNESEALSTTAQLVRPSPAKPNHPLKLTWQLRALMTVVCRAPRKPHAHNNLRYLTTIPNHIPREIGPRPLPLPRHCPHCGLSRQPPRQTLLVRSVNIHSTSLPMHQDRHTTEAHPSSLRTLPLRSHAPMDFVAFQGNIRAVKALPNQDQSDMEYI